MPRPAYTRASARLLALVVALSALPGCSVIMAATQPGKREVERLAIGVPMSLVRHEFGNPVASRDTPGGFEEVYQWRQGYRTQWKLFRVVFHAAADAFTFFLWEFAGMPLEAYFAGTWTTAEVEYDDSRHVTWFKVLSEKGIIWEAPYGPVAAND